MPDTSFLSPLGLNLKQLVTQRWNDSQSRFYILFSVCLGVMSFVLASLTPDPLNQQYIYVMGIVIFVLVSLFTLGLPLSWTLNLCMAYAFFHMVNEAIMTGGMFSNSLNWMAMLPIIPLFLIGVPWGVFWLIICLLCLCGMTVSSWLGWISPFYVAPPQTLQINAWNLIFLSIFLLALPLIYQRLYLRTLRTSEEKQANLLQSRAQ